MRNIDCMRRNIINYKKRNRIVICATCVEAGFRSLWYQGIGRHCKFHKYALQIIPCLIKNENEVLWNNWLSIRSRTISGRVSFDGSGWLVTIMPVSQTNIPTQFLSTRSASCKPVFFMVINQELARKNDIKQTLITEYI